jgi:hypothetical protein
MRSILSAIALISFCGAGLAQSPQKLSPFTRQYVSVDAPVAALVHIRVIDGTGAPPREDQTIGAGLIVIKGNPAKDINAIEKVETVFKEGVAYDSAKLIESVNGAVGLH